MRIGYLLAGFLFGSMYSILYSLAGALLSLAVMCLLKQYGKLHIISVSAAGGVFHNIGQLGAACVITGTLGVFSYLPFLIVSGTVTGLFTGLCAHYAQKYLKKYVPEM